MLFLFFSFCVDHPFGFSIYLFILLYLLLLLLFFFFGFFLFIFLIFFIYIDNGVYWEAPSCKVLYDSIKIGGHIDVMPIHVGQDQGLSGKDLLHHIWAFIGRAKLSSVIGHGLVALLQDQVAFFKDSGTNFIVECSFNTCWYNCPWHIAVMHFSSIMFNCSYHEWAHSAFDSSV